MGSNWDSDWAKVFYLDLWDNRKEWHVNETVLISFWSYLKMHSDKVSIVHVFSEVFHKSHSNGSSSHPLCAFLQWPLPVLSFLWMLFCCYWDEVQPLTYYVSQACLELLTLPHHFPECSIEDRRVVLLLFHFCSWEQKEEQMSLLIMSVCHWQSNVKLF